MEASGDDSLKRNELTTACIATTSLATFRCNISNRTGLAPQMMGYYQCTRATAPSSTTPNCRANFREKWPSKRRCGEPDVDCRWDKIVGKLLELLGKNNDAGIKA